MAVGQSPEWPFSGLDVAGARAGGWRPQPFREFVLKLHSHCNLACDYCYVYESEDQSWRTRPATLSEAVISRLASRIAEHADRHGLDEIEIVLHGGEPLMAGPKLIDFTVREIRSAMPASCRVDFSVQTNGLLLRERMLDLLDSHEVGVAVSIDGDRAGHDRHRRRVNGQGSYPSVRRGLDLLADRYRHLYRGLLCAVDVANDPVGTYEALLETAPPRIDFLLPHGTFTVPPPRRPVDDDGTTPYADWLGAVFDRWYGAPVLETGVRFFEEIMNMVLGGESLSENIGLSPVVMVVIDTDGTLQQVDTLKTSFHGGPDTGLSVFEHSFDQVLAHPGVVARQIGSRALAPPCQRCRVRDICGGGAYAHRYREGSGYLNPSIYCPDLLRLIDHVRDTVLRDLP